MLDEVDKDSSKFIERVISMFDEAYNWIEMERVFTERGLKYDYFHVRKAFFFS
jgi:hypothetical protein